MLRKCQNGILDGFQISGILISPSQQVCLFHLVIEMRSCSILRLFDDILLEAIGLMSTCKACNIHNVQKKIETRKEQHQSSTDIFVSGIFISKQC